MVFHWSISDSKSPQVPGTFLSILADLNNVVVWIVSTHSPTSKSSSLFYNPLMTIAKAPIMISIIVTFMFHSFFQYSSKVEVLILLFTFFQFYSVVSWDSKVHNFANSLFFWLITIRSGLLAEIMWSVCMSKSYWSLCVSFCRTVAGLCIYHLFVWSNLNFLHISQWITLPTQSCLVLYYFCANLLHSLIVWLIVSSLSPHNLHLLFCCVVSILTLIWLVLMTLSCAAIRSIIIIICSLLRVFHTSACWWFFTGVWVTTCLLKSQGLLSVFWLISIMQ